MDDTKKPARPPPTPTPLGGRILGWGLSTLPAPPDPRPLRERVKSG